MIDFNPDDFVTVYPGVFTEREKPLAEEYFAACRAINSRGPIDVKALVAGTLPKDTPGLGPVVKVNEAMVRYHNSKYDPENPIYNNAEYAKKLGLPAIMAFPSFAGHDDSFMKAYPAGARDTLLVHGLNHEFNFYKPIFPGDTLYYVVDGRYIKDITPKQGSIYRSLAMKFEGSIYNQKGEKVNDVIFRVVENLRMFKDPAMKEKLASFWEAPDWMRRPQHIYSDRDWDYIKSLWAKEKRRGSEPLYWEDVNIGDEPTWTVDGPIIASVTPTCPWGMALGGSLTLKKEIMNPEICKTLIKGEDGIYRTPNRADQVPPVPDDPATVKRPGGGEPEEETGRAILINFMGREYAIRHINNWMGDHGWISNIRWGIMAPETHAAYGKPVPVNPDAIRHLKKIPGMEDRFVNAHGMTTDLAILKSKVYDKYMCDGEYFVELGWWVESIDGYIWVEGGATVKLPSNNK